MRINRGVCIAEWICVSLHSTCVPGGGVGDADAPVLGDPGGGRPAVEVVEALFV